MEINSISLFYEKLQTLKLEPNEYFYMLHLVTDINLSTRMF
jgi:hypothetical protein